MDKDVFSEIAPLICDSHVHVGRFNDGYYFSPEEVYDKFKKLGIQKWTFSSTSTTDNDFEEVKNEIQELLNLAPRQAIPLLWVTPHMLELSEDLKMYDTIPFRGIKIHGYADNWNLNNNSLEQVMEVALKRGLPVLAHTGWDPGSKAGVYNDICRQFSKLTIILAHGRPIDETILVMKNNSNVYVDTAFMPLQDIRKIVKIFGSGRILFGTDFPIDKYYYPRQSIVARYKRRVNSLVENFGEEVFLKFANENFNKVFKCFFPLNN